MSEPVRVLLCGAGGYGEWYVTRLLAEAWDRNIQLVAAIEPRPENCAPLAELRQRQIPIFTSLEDFFAVGRCDLAIIASPIHLHAEQACLALGQGSHVLCEKPLCVGMDEVAQIERAERASGKTVTVGYQWSFSAAIQRFKADYLAGRFGAAKRLRTLLLWPRDDRYYRRNGWGGRLRLDSGRLVLDSPVNNAGAHYLHNMLYVLGPVISESVSLRRMQAQLWRAHLIENYDTAALRMETDTGVEISFYASHATRDVRGPEFIYEFEKATARYEPDHGRLVVTFTSGEVVDYGPLDAEPERKLWSAVESARTGRKPVCGLAAARAHVACVELAQQAQADIHDFPPSAIVTEGQGPETLRYVEGLQEILADAYQHAERFESLTAALLEKFGFADTLAVEP